MTRDDSASLRALAVQCRCMSRGVSGQDVAESLKSMAFDYDRKAEAAAAQEALVVPQPPRLPGTGT